MAEEVGVGYVRLLPSMRGFARAATRQLSAGLVGPARKAGKDAGDEAGDEFDRTFRGKLDRAGRLGRTFAKGFGRALVAGIKPVAAAAAGVFAAQFAASLGSALVSGAQLLGRGAGAGLALLPAAALAGAAAFGTLRLAVAGVGDALSTGLSGDVEAFDEALKGLSPSARGFAREVIGLKGGIDRLKATVQERFFGPLVDQVRPLGELYLPIATREMGLMARSFGQVASSVVSFLSMPDVANRLGLSLGFARQAVTDVVGAASHLPRAFLPLITVGSTFLPQLTGGLRGLTSQFASFMEQAERTGQLRSFIQGGLDAIGQLVATGAQVGRIFQDVGSILATVFGAAGLSGGGGLLTTIEGFTSGFAEFLQTAQGADVLAGVFDGIRLAVLAVKGPLGATFGLLIDVLGPLMPQIFELLGALGELADAVIDVGLEILEPPLHAIGDILGGAVLPALTGLARFLARNKPLLQGIAVAIGVMLVPAFVSWAISAGAAAVATLLALGPILLVGAAIAALATLVIIHFDTIKNAILTAFNWVKDNWPLLLAILTGPFGIAVLLITKHWDTIKAGVTAAKDWIVRKLGELVSWVTGLPGRLASAGAGMWSWIGDLLRTALNALIGIWNRLDLGIHFSVSVPSWVPGIGGRGFSIDVDDIVPDVPTLHTGGIFHTDGDEGLALLQDGEGVLSRKQMAAARSTVGGGLAPAGATLVLDARGADRRFVEWLRHFIRSLGGDVQTVLGA